MEKVAVIDVGSNSIRLVIFTVFSKGFNVIDEMKATVRLGEGLSQSAGLSASSMAAAVEALKRFAMVCQAHGARILAVATAAVRKADNGQAFIERIKAETGITVRLISGEEEAYMDYLGIVHSVDVSDGLMIDIGGGSTELVLIHDRKAVQSASLPFGSLDLTQTFDLAQSVTPAKEGELTHYLRQKFQQIPWLDGQGKGPLIGVGGIIRNMGKIDRKRKQYPLDLAHGYALSYEDVGSMYELVRGKDLAERKMIEGLSSDRADIIVGANAAVKGLMEYTRREELVISGYGLREGLVYHTMLTHHPLRGGLDDALETMMDFYQVNYRHAYHVYHLYTQLFDQLQALHGMGQELAKVNKVAALLHDIGLAIRFYNRHDHAYYLILNAGLVGLSHRELVLSAHIAASYRLKKFKAVADEFKNLLEKGDKLLIRKAGTLLQIADSLDRSLTEKVRDVKCIIENERVILCALSDQDCSLEREEAALAAPAFEKLFGKGLVVV